MLGDLRCVVCWIPPEEMRWFHMKTKKDNKRKREEILAPRKLHEGVVFMVYTVFLIYLGNFEWAQFYKEMQKKVVTGTSPSMFFLASLSTSLLR